MVFEHRSILVIRRIRSGIRLSHLVLGIKFLGLDNDETHFLRRNRERWFVLAFWHFGLIRSFLHVRHLGNGSSHPVDWYGMPPLDLYADAMTSGQPAQQ